MQDIYFFYGTLQDKEVLREVAGEQVLTKFRGRAELAGHQKVFLKDGSVAPGLFFDGQTAAQGVVYERLSEEERLRLSYFEGEEMVARVDKVKLEEGSELEAVVFHALGNELLTDRVWSFEYWLTHDKKEFLRKTKAWMEFYGTNQNPNWDEL